MTFICGNADEAAYREALGEDEPDAIDGLIEDLGENGSTWEEIRGLFTFISEESSDWQGAPIPIPDYKVILQKYHPLKWKYDVFNQRNDLEVDIVVGGPASEGPTVTAEEIVERITDRITGDGIAKEEFVRNAWYSSRLQATIYIYQRGHGKDAKVFHAKKRHAPDRSMERFTLALSTLGVIDAWDLKAEYTARETLKGMLSEHRWRMYELTGSFIEYSERSRLYYLFRKGRPTVVMTERWREGVRDDTMRILAVLCMHPIGYYARTWAGCMTPTDDVIAHLLMMRGDEAEFWGQANQHDPASPEAGL